MHDGVRLEAFPEPGVEGEIAVRRDQAGVMVGRLRIDIVAARRLDADHDIAETMNGEAEGAAGEERVGVGRAPAFGQCDTVGFGNCREECVIVAG